MNCQSVKQPTACHFYNATESLCPPPAPHITTLLQCVPKSQMKILTVSELVPKMESNITISASFKSENRIKTAQQNPFFKRKKENSLIYNKYTMVSFQLDIKLR